MRLLPLWLLLSACAPVADGTEAWEAGDPAGAVEQWSSVEGRPSAAVHYNLGIAAYRAGDRPLALAHWRAARRIAPRAGDVVHNLAHARGELKGVSAPVPEPTSWMEFATPVELGGLGALLLALASLGLLRSARREEGGLVPLLGLAAVGLVLGVSGVQGANAPGVLVLTRDAVLRDAPDATGRERGSLGAGSELYVEAAAGPWVRVWDGAERRGWVPADSGLVAGPVDVGQARRVGVADAAVPERTGPPEPTDEPG